MLPSLHDASVHCGGVGVVVVVVGVTVVVVLVVVVVVGGNTQGGGSARGEEASTLPLTGSQPAFPGPRGQPHQFCCAFTVGVVVLSRPTSRLPVMLLLFAVTIGRNASPEFPSSRRMPASVAPVISLHVSMPVEFAVGFGMVKLDETTRMPTFPGSVVLDSTV